MVPQSERGGVGRRRSQVLVGGVVMHVCDHGEMEYIVSNVVEMLVLLAKKKGWIGECSKGRREADGIKFPAQSKVYQNNLHVPHFKL